MRACRNPCLESSWWWLLASRNKSKFSLHQRLSLHPLLMHVCPADLTKKKLVANAGKLMKKLGHVRDEWAPDSGMFEASIGDELRRMYMPATRDDAHRNDGPIAFPVPPAEAGRGALDGNVVSIEVSEEAVVRQGHTVPIPLSQPVLSCWLHWGKLPSSRETPDLDLSAVLFDAKARVTETVFYRNLLSHHEAVSHTGDDTDVRPGEEGEGEHDRAAGTRRMEGIVIELPRIPASCHVIVLTVSCYSGETPAKLAHT